MRGDNFIFIKLVIKYNNFQVILSFYSRQAVNTVMSLLWLSQWDAFGRAARSHLSGFPSLSLCSSPVGVISLCPSDSLFFFPLLLVSPSPSPSSLPSLSLSSCSSLLSLIPALNLTWPLCLCSVHLSLSLCLISRGLLPFIYSYSLIPSIIFDIHLSLYLSVKPKRAMIINR